MSVLVQDSENPILKVFSKCVVTFLVCVCSPFVSAQTFPDDNGAILKGVKSVDARFGAKSWLNVSADQDRFTSNGQSSFELALRRDGVIVEGTAPNYLFCNVTAAQSTSSGLVFYTYMVQYYLFNPDGVHLLLWESGGVATIGSNRFSAETAANDCANLFANEWLKQNPKE